MALVIGTNSGFVTTAPSADPEAGNTLTISDAQSYTGDTSPATAKRITEIGWWANTGGTDVNFEVGLYADDGTVVPGEAGTLLQVSRINATGTSSGWIRVTGLNWRIDSSTKYYIAVQIDDAGAVWNTDNENSGGAGFDRVRTGITTLSDPFDGGAFRSGGDGMMAFYAVWDTEEEIIDNVVSHWKLDDNLDTNVVLDAHNGNDGTVVNDQNNYSSEQSTGTAKIVRAFDFDGTNDSVTIPSFNVVDGMTISAWIRFEEFGSGDDQDIVVRKGTVYGNTGNVWLLQVEDSTVSFIIKDLTGPPDTNEFHGDTTLNPNTWYHIVGTYDGTTMRIYLNGDEDGNIAAPEGIASSANDIYIGGRPDGNDMTTGIIDEVTIWNRALTSTEITTLYNSGSGLAYPFTAVEGTNMKINIGDAWKDVDSIKINIGDAWKDVTKVEINIGDSWKTVF